MYCIPFLVFLVAGYLSDWLSETDHLIRSLQQVLHTGDNAPQSCLNGVKNGWASEGAILQRRMKQLCLQNWCMSERPRNSTNKQIYYYIRSLFHITRMTLPTSPKEEIDIWLSSHLAFLRPAWITPNSWSYLLILADRRKKEPFSSLNSSPC